MEPISKILKGKQTPTNTSKANTDIWSSADEEPSPSAKCPLCEGAGFVHPLLPNGKPDYSQVIACRCTRKESGKDLQERLQRYSNLGPLARFTFDNLMPQGRSGNPLSQQRFASAFEAAKDFATEPKGWLVLVGPSGCGKTHLAAAIANERLKQGQPAFYITVPDLLDHLRAAFNPDSEIQYDQFFEQVRNTPLLILDDLGVQTSTPWAKEKLDQLFTHRFNSELPTVIVAITPVEQLEDRIRTRLTNPDFCHIHTLEDRPTTPEFDWGPEFALQRSMTFNSFERRPNLSPEQQENLELVYRTALEFAKSPEGWLVLVGVTGCGKTHLAAAIVNYRYQAGKPAKFVVVPEFLDHLRSTFSPESKISYDQLFESVKKTPLLVLDDFGEQSTTPWAQEKLYQVINYRYNAQLATVVTTRCALEELDSPVGSRLVAAKISTVWNINVPDYRSSQRFTPKAAKKTYSRSKKDRWE